MTTDPVPTMQVSPIVPPSAKAQVGFWLGVINTGGLMALGAYCLYGAVEAQHVAGAAGLVVGVLGAVLRLR